MSTPIPFAKLGIPIQLEDKVGPGAPAKVKLALARGLVPLDQQAQLGVLYLLTTDEDTQVSAAARASLRDLPDKQVLSALSLRTHPKILEFLAEFREVDPSLDERIGMMRTANDRTVRMISRRAGATLCEMISGNHERLLMTPDVYIDLHANPNCSEAFLQRAMAFLRMQRQLPEVPELRPFELAPESASPVDEVVDAGMDLEAEIEAALGGFQSPAFLKQQAESLKSFDLDELDQDDSGLGTFQFDLTDASDTFTWDLTGEITVHDNEKADVRRGVEAKIGEMSVGQKIKLAYMGNKETRAILIRDTNKIVAAAVVRSGRLTDSEVAVFAGNKNLDNEVLREIANNGEWTRKYPVKVALVNNPKTPVSTAVSLVNSLQKKDLMTLTRNRNVPSVITQAADRLYRQKYRK